MQRNSGWFWSMFVCSLAWFINNGNIVGNNGNIVGSYVTDSANACLEFDPLTGGAFNPLGGLLGEIHTY